MAKKILIIPSWYIWPLDLGGNESELVFLKRLSEEHELHLLITPENVPQDYLRDFVKSFSFLTVHVAGYQKIVMKSSAIFSSFINKSKESLKETFKKVTKKELTLSSADLYIEFSRQIENVKYVGNRILNLLEYNQVLIGELSKLLKNEKFDIIQAEMVEKLGLVDFFPKDSKKIFIHHELMALKVSQMFDLLTIIPEDYKRTLINITEFLEDYYLRKYDLVVTLSQDDRQYLDNRLKTNTISSPFTLFNEFTGNKFNTEIEPTNIIFVGSGFHLPNLHGLEWFLVNVYPNLKKDMPNLVLKITGRWPIVFKKRFKSGDVIFVGDVNVHELEDLFLSSILVSPIFIGSGLRRKILFAMRKGTPVVSTTLGARGIPYVQDSRDIILADNAKAFENGVRNLFLNKELRKTVSENSRKLFETEFNFEKLYNIRRKLYE